MARLKQGMYGVLTGRLGNLVSYVLNGKPVTRTIGTVTKPPSIAQLAVRQRMSVLNKVLSDMLGFINVGFALAVIGTDRNPYNEATSENFNAATTGDYPDFTVDYSKLLVSKGSLTPALGAAANLLTDGVEFTWQLGEDINWESKNDRTMLLLYFPTKGEMIYVLTGAQRRDERDFIGLTPAYLSTPMQAYIAFASEDRKKISNSMWVGWDN